MNRCQGLAGLLFGHKFKPRYDEGKPLPYQFQEVLGSDLIDILQASKPITYRHDVCERCGQTIMTEQK